MQKNRESGEFTNNPSEFIRECMTIGGIMCSIKYQGYILSGLMILASGVVSAAETFLQGELLQSFSIADAYQGVAIGPEAFYAINNRAVTKADRFQGEIQVRLQDDRLMHLDSGVIVADRLYAAHSNYPAWPMASAVEIRDASSLEHLDFIPLNVTWGSLTWLDWFNGQWWGAFAGYDVIQAGQQAPYAGTDSTRIVRFNDDYSVAQAWSFPAELLARMKPMSNSGGSWGADGYLYLSGHDHPEIYIMAVPDSGSELVWLATVTVEGFDGQGIAWDRSGQSRELWGIQRDHRQVVKIGVPVFDPVE